MGSWVVRSVHNDMSMYGLDVSSDIPGFGAGVSIYVQNCDKLLACGCINKEKMYVSVGIIMSGLYSTTTGKICIDTLCVALV